MSDDKKPSALNRAIEYFEGQHRAWDGHEQGKHYSMALAAMYQARDPRTPPEVDAEGLREEACEFVCGGYELECLECVETILLIDHLLKTGVIREKTNAKN